MLLAESSAGESRQWPDRVMFMCSSENSQQPPWVSTPRLTEQSGGRPQWSDSIADEYVLIGNKKTATSRK